MWIKEIWHTTVQNSALYKLQNAMRYAHQIREIVQKWKQNDALIFLNLLFHCLIILYNVQHINLL